MNKHIKNILNNTSILEAKYNKCIIDGKDSFKQIEKLFIEKLIVEIDKNLQEYLNTHEVDFHKDIQGSYYEVLDLVRFNEWDEYKEYITFINRKTYDRSAIHKFMYKSLSNYGFPMEHVFNCNDNGWFRYKLMDFNTKNSSSSIGENYESYEY